MCDSTSRSSQIGMESSKSVILCIVGFNARPHPGPLPQGEGESFAGFLKYPATGLVQAAFTNPKSYFGLFSPWGEEAGEGGRETKLKNVPGLKAPASCQDIEGPKQAVLEN